MNMSIYLHDIPLPEARAKLEAVLRDAGLFQVLGEETISLDEQALGRVLSQPIWARQSSPHYHAAAMDGFAVRSRDTVGAQPSKPVVLVVSSSSSKINASLYVNTGDAIPDWSDAVIPVENVEALDASGEVAGDPQRSVTIQIRAAVSPWSHVRLMGEDIVTTQLVLPAGQVLRPVDLGAIAAAGLKEVQVARRPRVAILPTGSELVPPGSELRPGEIPEFNSLVLAAQVQVWGGEATRFPITPDDFDLICSRITDIAGAYDLILLNAGSSAGSEDFSARAVEKLGVLMVHGVAVRPGHPVILGIIRRPIVALDKQSDSEPSSSIVPIIGVPGYPVSTALTAEIFVEPLLAIWLGRQPLTLEVESAQLTRKVTSPAGDDDFLRVAVAKVGDRLLAAPLSRGAGVITSLVRADGLVILPRGVQGVEAGENVKVHLYRPRSDLEHTILCIGSHDLSLDLLAQFLASLSRRFISANVGSLGGLIALQRGEAHLAGSHLLDPETGDYNLSYIPKYLEGIKVKVIAFVKREQGLLVKKANPKNIQGLEDLARSEITFVNRQRGAGTRVLFDFQLNLRGIPFEAIKGYNQEEYTHLGVAAAISSGRADCGLGIAAAAQALDLLFLPLFQERYDLIVPQIYAESELLTPLFEVLAEKRFREAVVMMPGYDISIMGKVIAEV